MNNDFIITQKNLCADYGAIFYPTPAEKKVGISLSVKDGQLPINGLRHPAYCDTTGWYIWAGDYSDDPAFFKPLHTHHLIDWCPSIIKFLGLPPGWRFLKVDDYEDVWFDSELLKT